MGLVYTIQTFEEYYSDNGIFGIYAGTNHDNVLKLITEINKELNNFIKNGISDFEFSKAIKQAKSSLVMSLESINHRAQRVGNNILKYNHFISNNEIINIINSLKIDDVIFSMSNILNTKSTLVCYGNLNEDISKNIEGIVV